MDPALLACASVLIGMALWISHGHYHPAALALVTAGAAASVAALRARWSRPWMAQAVLCAGTVVSLAAHAASSAAPAFIALAAVAAVLALSYLSPRPVPGRFPGLLACFAGMGALVLWKSPVPWIDVWMFQHEGARALLHGRNPYELVFPNIYGHQHFYGPGMLVGGRVVVFPYPPLVVVFDAASLLLGDLRWGFLAAVVAAGWCMGRRNRASELPAAFAMFQPSTFFVLTQAWTEPTVLAAWALTLLLWRRPAGAGVGAGLLLGLKQYTPLLLLPLAFTRPPRKVWLIAFTLAAASALPFALWNFGELWRDVVVAQFLQPLRLDALSWLAACARWTGLQLPSALGFLAAAGVIVFGLRGRDRSLQRAAATAATAFVAFLLFNKQAFCNYYWLAAGMIASAVSIDEVAECGSGAHRQPVGGEANSPPMKAK